MLMYNVISPERKDVYDAESKRREERFNQEWLEGGCLKELEMWINLRAERILKITHVSRCVCPWSCIIHIPGLAWDSPGLCDLVQHLSRFFFLKLLSALVRNNRGVINCTHLKCLTRWVLTHVYTLETITTTKVTNVSFSPEVFLSTFATSPSPAHHLPSPCPKAAIDLLSHRRFVCVFKKHM